MMAINHYLCSMVSVPMALELLMALKLTHSIQVMFIEHNLLSDQFFTDVDLIACRNTLTDFDRVPLQCLQPLSLAVFTAMISAPSWSSLHTWGGV